MYIPASVDNLFTDKLLFDPGTPQQILHGKSILCIDDEYVNYLYFSEFISGTGATLIHASSVNQAFSYFTLEPHLCLILISESFCITTDAKIISQIKNISSGIPVIGIRNNDGKVSDKFFRMGCDLYIKHPIDRIQIVNTIIETMKDGSNNQEKCKIAEYE